MRFRLRTLMIVLAVGLLGAWLIGAIVFTVEFMNAGLAVYIALCFGIGLMALERIDYGRWRWSLAGMLKFTLLVAFLLALGRLLAKA